MKTIYILRHAEAEFAVGNDDLSRVLTKQGKNDAMSLGHQMENHALWPDLALCSPSARTKETLQIVSYGLPMFEKRCNEKIYNASAEELLALVNDTEDDVSSVLIVGHNPAIFGLAVMLSEHGDLSLIKNLLRGYNPGSMTVIESDVETWAEISPANTKLAGLLLPQNQYKSD